MHIPSNNSKSISSVPLITYEIRKKIRRRNKTHAKAKTTGDGKLRSKFKSLRREIKAKMSTINMSVTGLMILRLTQSLRSVYK